LATPYILPKTAEDMVEICTPEVRSAECSPRVSERNAIRQKWKREMKAAIGKPMDKSVVETAKSKKSKLA